MANRMRLLIVTLLFAALFPSATLAHGGIDDDELIIRVRAEGFAPQELTVTQNDAVLFINNDEVSHWPFYAHDGGSDVKPGASAKLSFPNAGTFNISDKKNPAASLTVVALADPAEQALIGAESSGKPALWQRIKLFFSGLFRPKEASAKVDEKVLADFKSLGDVEKYSWINEISEDEGPAVAWRYIVAAYTTPEGVVGNAHDMAHLVGQLLYKKYGFQGLATCTPTFAFGCYHGVMQVAFDKEKPNEFPRQLAAAKVGCEEVVGTDSPSYWSCIHGVGHGVATYREFDLNTSLADCDTYSSSVATYCHDGVFMEFVVRAPENYYKKTDPLFPCNAIGAAYKIGCARNQVQVMKQKFSMADANIAAACLGSGEWDISYHCIDAIGYGVGQAAQGNPARVIEGCNAITNKNAAAQCLAAAAGELVFQNAADWQSSVKVICESVTGSLRDACEARVHNVKQSYGR